MSRAALAAALAGTLAAGLVACGPYPDVAQKLDVTTPITDSETWIAAAGTELRVLVLGRPSAGGDAEFAFAAMEMPISAGTSASALRGTWRDDGAGAATFSARLEYTLRDERALPLLARLGSYRDDVSRTLRVSLTQDADGLVLGGDPALAGSYVRLRPALARLGTTTADDAACAFQIANLALRSSELRIIGFGGAGMSQYRSPETFVGTVEGTIRVSAEGTTTISTSIVYEGFVDFPGVRVDGNQDTRVNLGGDGHMSGVVSFVLEPRADGGAAAPITGAIDYGGGGDPASAVVITNGLASGGSYVVALAGGGLAKVSPVTAPTPSVAQCLALP